MNIFLPKQLQQDKFSPRLFVLLLLCLRSVYELVIGPVIPSLLNRLEERIYDYVWGEVLGGGGGVVRDSSTEGITDCHIARYNVEF